MAANERQVGGEHYKIGGEEHWDRAARLRFDYFQGQITKYVERWKDKNGIEDLRKAAHFLEKYIEIESTRSTGTFLEKKAVEAGRIRLGAFGEFAHASTDFFVMEGVKEGIVMYTCRKCHTAFQVKLDDEPSTVHECVIAGGPGKQYVDQG